MASVHAVSPLVLTLVAGGFTIFGVALKIGYDSLAARRAAKNAGLERFADERRQVYETFTSWCSGNLRETRPCTACCWSTEKARPRYQTKRKLASPQLRSAS